MPFQDFISEDTDTIYCLFKNVRPRSISFTMISQSLLCSLYTDVSKRPCMFPIFIFSFPQSYLCFESQIELTIFPNYACPLQIGPFNTRVVITKYILRSLYSLYLNSLFYDTVFEQISFLQKIIQRLKQKTSIMIVKSSGQAL